MKVNDSLCRLCFARNVCNGRLRDNCTPWAFFLADGTAADQKDYEGSGYSWSFIDRDPRVVARFIFNRGASEWERRGR